MNVAKLTIRKLDSGFDQNMLALASNTFKTAHWVLVAEYPNGTMFSLGTFTSQALSPKNPYPYFSSPGVCRSKKKTNIFCPILEPWLSKRRCSLILILTVTLIFRSTKMLY